MFACGPKHYKINKKIILFKNNFKKGHEFDIRKKNKP